MQGELQQILGTDKRNPCFTIFRGEKGNLLLFYGGELRKAITCEGEKEKGEPGLIRP